MTKFKWSPEAIEAGRREALLTGHFTAPFDAAWATRRIGEALTTAQPVVAPPPCPTCKGSGKGEKAGTAQPYPSGRWPCPACNGSGVEQLIPVSEIRAWIASHDGGPDRGSLNPLSRLLDWLDDRGRS